MREDASKVELARQYEVHANQIYKWKRQLLENLERAFESETGGGANGSEREAELLQKIGELTVERDFLSRGLGRLRRNSVGRWSSPTSGFRCGVSASCSG